MNPKDQYRISPYRKTIDVFRVVYFTKDDPFVPIISELFYEFKTYGGLLDALQPFLSAACKDAHVKYFGTYRFFVMQAELVHLAFDKFCELNGVSPEDTGRLFKDVIWFVVMYDLRPRLCQSIYNHPMCGLAIRVFSVSPW